MGDLVELYVAIHAQDGEARADRWFYGQVICSLWPLLKVDETGHQRPYVSVAMVLLSITLLGWGVAYRLRPSPHQPPLDAVRSYELGTGLLRDNDSYQASKTLERTLEIDNKYALAHARLAEALTELDSTDGAKDEMLRASALVREQVALSDLDSLYFDGIQALLTHDFARAINAYKKMVVG